MHYHEYHSHKWARTLGSAVRRWRRATSGPDPRELHRLYHGDTDQPDAVFPGLRVMAPYWQAVEGEMRCRFDCLYEYSAPALQDLIRTPQAEEEVARFYSWFLSDVGRLAEKYGMAGALDEPFRASLVSARSDPDWVKHLEELNADTAPAVEAGRLPWETMARWLRFCAARVANYNYHMIRQAVYVCHVLKAAGRDGLDEILASSREEFGWRVSRLFFVESLPKGGIDDPGELVRLGRYAMFSDQDLNTEEVTCPAGEEARRLKTTVFYNCMEYSIFHTVSHHLDVDYRQAGLGICVYCEEHARKNTMLFVPPSYRPTTCMEAALGLGDDVCRFVTTLEPADDMERFMLAQSKLYGEEGSDLP
ncbi:MAG: hypothetical protein AB1445_03430 [Bacillota bacterium]